MGHFFITFPKIVVKRKLIWDSFSNRKKIVTVISLKEVFWENCDKFLYRNHFTIRGHNILKAILKIHSSNPPFSLCKVKKSWSFLKSPINGLGLRFFLLIKGVGFLKKWKTVWLCSSYQCWFFAIECFLTVNHKICYFLQESHFDSQVNFW